MNWYKMAFLEPEDIARLDAANEYRPSGELQRSWGQAPLDVRDLLQEKSRELLKINPVRETIIDEAIRRLSVGTIKDDERAKAFLEKDERASAMLDEFERISSADEEIVPSWQKEEEKEKTIDKLVSLSKENSQN